MASTTEQKVTSIDRSWVLTEFVKEIDVERTLASDAKTRAEAPPDRAMGVLYHEIAAADDRHVMVIERIATRYGHTPSQPQGSAIGHALGQLKEKIVELGRVPMEQLSLDLAAKARSVQWLTAWLSAFEAIGDCETARELSTVLTEDRAHLDALQQSFNRMVEQNARGPVETTNGQPATSPIH
jgi:hypothetical protein